VVEDTVLRPAPVITSLTLQDDAESCDSDGILDPGERGAVSVVVQNASMAQLRGAVLHLDATTPGLLLADTELVVPDVGPLGEVTLDVPAALRPGGRPIQAGAFTAPPATRRRRRARRSVSRWCWAPYPQQARRPRCSVGCRRPG